MAGIFSIDALRADAMETNTNCSNIGGGAGTTTETDIVYQNTGSVSRKVTSGGFYTDTAANRDASGSARRTWMAKVAVGNFSGATLLQLRYGSGTNAYYTYDIFSGAGNYPAPQGGFLFIPIDHSIVGYRDATSGNPNMASAAYFGAYLEGPTSKGENLIMDAVDLVYGISVVGVDANFDQFRDHDEGILANRYGLFTEPVNKTFQVYGRLTIGATTSNGVLTTGACTFSASDRSLLFPDGRFAAGWSGVTLDIRNASTDIDLDGIKFIGLGSTSISDTRPTFEVLGTSGSFDASACTFDACASITLTSVCNVTNSVISNCGVLDAAGASLAGSSVSGGTAASAVLWDVNSDPNTQLTGCDFTSGGSGHAIELGTNSPTTISLTNVGFSGYAGSDGSTGDEAVWVRRTGGTVTINVSGGNVPTIRTDGATVNVVTGQRALTIKGVPSGAEWRLYEDSASPGVIGTISLDGAESHGGGDITYNYSYSSDTEVVLQVIANGYEEFQRYFTLQDSNQTQTVNLSIETNT